MTGKMKSGDGQYDVIVAGGGMVGAACACLFAKQGRRVFGSRSRPLSFARNLALAGIELCPPAKRMLLWRTMGMAAAAARE
ncbi:MAG: hypothetical protein OD918_07685 [Gammaproteobacteria bacterium]